VSPLTGVLTEAWDLYRRFARHFLLISFVIYIITAAVVALLSLAGIAGAIIGGVISFAAT
jgi:F0F1-type ATP synthase assembly protein I